MERKFDEELKDLKQKLTNMASVVERMIDDAINGLENSKADLLQEVFKYETNVNKIHIEIDQMCLKLLALRQPIAVDLRLIMSAMKINSELERIGDQAVNIAENATKFLQNVHNIQLVYIPKMAEIVQRMVLDSIDSFVNRDAELANKVLSKDDEVDDLKTKVFKKLISQIIEDTSNTEKLMDLILISRNLEKIADHTTNISEDVIFMLSGKDIRHHILDTHV